MKKIVKLFAALGVAGLLGALSGAMQTTLAVDSTKGCWYEPPNPPACDICGWSCGSGQKCCTINEQ